MKKTLYEDGEPCDKHKACYAHKLTPCEGCGRINMISIKEEKKEKTIVSFDFDGTLNEHFMGNDNPHEDEIKQLFVELVDSDDFDVYIITRRFGPKDADKGLKDEHTTVYKMLDELNIVLPEEKVLFTNRSYKFKLIEKLGVDIHLDDDKREHTLIKKFTNAGSVDVQDTNWRKEFDELLK